MSEVHRSSTSLLLQECTQPNSFLYGQMEYATELLAVMMGCLHDFQLMAPLANLKRYPDIDFRSVALSAKEASQYSLGNS